MPLYAQTDGAARPTFPGGGQYIMPWAVFALMLLATTCIQAEVYLPAGPLSAGLIGDADNTMWFRMIDSLKVDVVDAQNTYGTMLAPTDRAVNTFLTNMGMTFEELLARPMLVDLILAYHFVPGVSIKDWYGKSGADPSKDIVSSIPDQPTFMTTGDVNYVISAYKSPGTGLIVLNDVQGGKAVVVGSSRALGNNMFYDISSVLMSGGYFFKPSDAIEHYPTWATSLELIAKAALYSENLATRLSGVAPSTFLMPSYDALKGMGKNLARAPAEDLIQLIEYHIIDGVRPVPTGWKNDEAVVTLLGRTLTAKLSRRVYVEPFTGVQQLAPSLTLVPEVGRPAEVTLMNIFAGRSVFQGINGALVPNTSIVQSVSSGWGRRLMQYTSRNTRQSKANTWAPQNLQAAVKAASAGSIPVSYATAAGSRNALMAAGGCVNCMKWRW